MEKYWNSIWNAPDIVKYTEYVKSYIAWEPSFLDFFAERKVQSICDAGCGFGAYSVMLAKKGYYIDGFDISKNAVALTLRMLQTYDCAYGEYKVCDINQIDFADNRFDAVVAHAVIDHVPQSQAIAALDELCRITNKNGLLYITFDPLDEEDINKPHVLLDDGSRQYNDGLLFRHYTDTEIHEFLSGKEIVYSSTNKRGERELILIIR